MTISEEELNAKRLRVAHLRREISSLRTEGSATRVAAEQEITSKALDEEIERLESQVVEEAKSAGGTVEDAIAAMERAAMVEKMATPEKKEEATEVKESVESVNADLRPVDGGESSSPHLDIVDNPNSNMELEGHDVDDTDEKNEEVSR